MSAAAPARVAFLLPSIRGGGMERLVSILLRGLDRSRFDVELVVLHRRGENAAVRDALPDHVRITYFDKRSRLDAVRVLPRLVRHLRASPPSLAVGFMTYPNLMLLAAARMLPGRLPVVATEHVTPDALRATAGKRAQLWLAGRLYPGAAAVVAVSEGLRGALIAELHLPPARVRTIYNPFDPEIDAMAAPSEPPHPWLVDGQPVLVAVGRLAQQKAYPNLLRALALVRREVPARLLVLGAGEERAALEALAAELGVAEAARFLGYVANPFPYMRQATAFVLASDWETMGFVLVEAARVGAAIVATDVEFGPNEIIEPERSGLLVPPADPRALADAILRILRDPELGQRLRAGAIERAERFTPAASVAAYADLFQAVIRR
jgi:glycosyltransferase involved in cell wall biosynthesis